MKNKALFIAATGQNVGKTTLCLGIIAALKKRFDTLGFIKPVGQQHVEVSPGLLVDKDVILFKERFSLPANYKDMSPVIFPRGFTRDMIDQKVNKEALVGRIHSSYQQISQNNTYTIVEGTGHVGVGSLVGISNAFVAKELGLDMVIIAKGGLGSAFDELALNKALADLYGVTIRGIILNRVFPEKRDMIVTYMKKALKAWDIPLIGAIPYDRLLSTPSMRDFSLLFNAPLLSGESSRHAHFSEMRLVATSAETFRELTFPDQLLVTPASREDVVDMLLEIHPKVGPPEQGLIFTGRHAPTRRIIKLLSDRGIPSLYANHPTFETMHMITSHTAKIQNQDTSKVDKAIEVVEKNLDFSLF